MLDFPWAMFVRRVFLNPSQHLAVAFAGGEFGFKGFGRDPGKPEPVIITRVVVFEFAGGAGQFGPAFVEDAGEDDKAAEANPRAARRAFGQIGSVIQFLIHAQNYQRAGEKQARFHATVREQGLAEFPRNENQSCRSPPR